MRSKGCKASHGIPKLQNYIKKGLNAAFHLGRMGDRESGIRAGVPSGRIEYIHSNKYVE